jgi:hypothetical protein
MKRISWLSLILGVLFATVPTQAQDHPRVDLFAGYTTLNFKPSFDSNRTQMHGWNSNVAVTVKWGMGVAADFSGQYGKLNGQNLRLHTAMFGPRFAFHNKRWGGYTQLLFGTITLSGSNEVLTPLIGVRSDSGYAFAPGAGLEVKINEKLSYRIVQFDSVTTNLGNSSQLALRFSTGLSFHFGKAR